MQQRARLGQELVKVPAAAVVGIATGAM